MGYDAFTMPRTRLTVAPEPGNSADVIPPGSGAPGSAPDGWWSDGGNRPRFSIDVYLDRTWRYAASLRAPCSRDIVELAVGRKFGPGNYRIRACRYERDPDTNKETRNPIQDGWVGKIPGRPRERPAPAAPGGGGNVDPQLLAVLNQLAGRLEALEGRAESPRVTFADPGGGSMIEKALALALPELVKGYFSSRAAVGGGALDPRAYEQARRQGFSEGVERGRLEVEAEIGGDEQAAPVAGLGGMDWERMAGSVIINLVKSHLPGILGGLGGGGGSSLADLVKGLGLTPDDGSVGGGESGGVE